MTIHYMSQNGQARLAQGVVGLGGDNDIKLPEPSARTSAPLEYAMPELVSAPAGAAVDCGELFRSWAFPHS